MDFSSSIFLFLVGAAVILPRLPAVHNSLSLTRALELNAPEAP
jgi:hypothetical protein